MCKCEIRSIIWGFHMEIAWKYAFCCSRKKRGHWLQHTQKNKLWIWVCFSNWFNVQTKYQFQPKYKTMLYQQYEICIPAKGNISLDWSGFCNKLAQSENMVYINKCEILNSTKAIVLKWIIALIELSCFISITLNLLVQSDFVHLAQIVANSYNITIWHRYNS